MPNKFLILGVLAFFYCFSVVAQDKNDKKIIEALPVIETDSIIVKTREPMDALSPARAAFYSAILPGLGQAYNKKYWKIPLVYGALGTGIYFFVSNQKEYNRYRDAYKSRLAGFTDDEFYFDSEGNKLDTPRVSTTNLERGQEFYRKNKDLSLLITVGLYALNIIDANVDAHLLQYNVDDNLTLAPHYEFNEFDASSNLGLTLNFKF
ncbi:hypothetical protein APS56_14490 [Pseudalgibacter alginicilyticus]|uniref:DUF5683 domain-containing protein n=1 Tax=Pseudalgibacter alginicilyticus TaxID=1736674 RepID=A0A0P0CJ75_9FLAO|nr:DUF5683 domain-containing protein [Pseudalgibacter alginicilyticus]ALJ06269.1 hypothetical protein APS56_14490 [Pseudalgibacter alginicilyticus]